MWTTERNNRLWNNDNKDKGSFYQKKTLERLQKYHAQKAMFLYWVFLLILKSSQVEEQQS